MRVYSNETQCEKIVGIAFSKLGEVFVPGRTQSPLSRRGLYLYLLAKTMIGKLSLLQPHLPPLPSDDRLYQPITYL